MVGKDSPIQNSSAPSRPIFQSERNQNTASIWANALLGGLLIWLSFPPVNWSWLAWVAPIPWLRIVNDSSVFRKRNYLQLYFAGFIHWLLMLHWIRLPHWTAVFGWLLLSIYLAIYLPLLIGISRWIVQRTKFQLWLIAPCVWTTLEWMRGYLLTGFSLCLWGHTQVQHPVLIQCADLGGAYLVGFILILVAATIDHAYRSSSWSQKIVSLVCTASILAVNWNYGLSRLQNTSNFDQQGPFINATIIQGSIDTTFGSPPIGVESQIEQYVRLTGEAIANGPLPDILIWPETMYPWPLLGADEGAPIPHDEAASLSPTEMAEIQADFPGYLQRRNATQMNALVHRFPTQWILGASWAQYRADKTIDHFNSVLHLDSDGHILSRYDKMHPVMFGEYVPLGNVFPWLYRLTPMPYGLTAGTSPIVADVHGQRLSTSICFENTVPHLIASHIRYLDAAGTSPQILVTVTNDGWFWGSSLLDLHLACAVFRSVEHHCTGLVAANTGLSAWIDPAGRVVKRGPRRQTGVLKATIPSYPVEKGIYRRHGDVFCGLCAAVVLASAAWAAKR
ncbi:MAG: apolipoprotein N-acyltransferase [Planctomycetota bacterium]|nr:apolipoprotein N-acyltransferase [Planctomycetota bacterium]MDA1179376.1 apolipoprotein N-acyltransferase [Planctomycetota bacterium]